MSYITKLKQLAKNSSLLNGALFSLFSFINRGISFLLLLVLGNYITPPEYGYLSLFGTVVMVIGYFIAMTTEGYLSISYFQDGKEGLRKSFSSILCISLVAFLLFNLIVLLGGETLSDYVDLDSDILYYAIGVSFFTLFSNVILDLFRIQERIFIYGLLSCGNALLNFAISIYLVKGLMLNWEGRVYAQFFCAFLFGVYGLYYFIKHGYFTTHIRPYLKVMLLWGIPLIPHLATTFIRQGCDRYIINFFHTMSDVGLFSFALNLSNIIFMIGVGFNQSNSIDIYKVLGNKELGNKDKLDSLMRQKKQIFYIYTGSSVLVTLFCYVLLPFVLPKYTDCLPYFIVLAVYAFLQCMYLLYTNFLFYYKQTKTIMYITFSSGILHLALSLWLTRYSLYYTCVIYVLTQGLVLLLIRWNANKVLKMNLVQN